MLRLPFVRWRGAPAGLPEERIEVVWLDPELVAEAGSQRGLPSSGRPDDRDFGHHLRVGAEARVVPWRRSSVGRERGVIPGPEPSLVAAIPRVGAGAVLAALAVRSLGRGVGWGRWGWTLRDDARHCLAVQPAHDHRTSCELRAQVDLMSGPADDEIAALEGDVPLVKAAVPCFCGLVPRVPEDDVASVPDDLEHLLHDRQRIDHMVEGVARVGDIERGRAESFHEPLPSSTFRRHGWPDPGVAP